LDVAGAAFANPGLCISVVPTSRAESELPKNFLPRFNLGGNEKIWLNYDDQDLFYKPNFKRRETLWKR